ncbi:hypothetical protein GGR28_001860 [Lewinella aquimaris]|uniref:Alginate lyase domain-containing protein n=1 Tax=Neolewinella aquimaris TaxID=1835722 RepID=A0A840E2B7_9BACT|nr:alginate lyase family protein [Neolewinella aquimaris]MBB4079240.1 hypothetical protein [Neolewinella aquimaris]
MWKTAYLPLLLASVLACSCAPPPRTSAVVKTEVTLTNYPGDRLVAIKEAYRKGEPVTTAALEATLRRADEELNGEIYTIVHKEVLPPSGNPNDYISLGPYWWPDPDQPDGLPWIRRDGEVNPLTQGERSDKSQQNAFARGVSALAYAAYFTDKDVYRRRAETLIRAFLIDPKTKMNPHLEYAQGIPGRNSGRCFGIIELTDVVGMVTSLEVLDLAGLDPEVKAGTDEWLAAYLHWLQTSKLGVEEKERENNHGTWYDAQVLSMLIHLGQTKEAGRVAETVKRRIDTQIEPDGAQPHELARTKSLSYSTMNLRAFTTLAYLAGTVGVDLWNYSSPRGGSIPKAYAYLEPYARGEVEWTQPQLGDLATALYGTRELFAEAGSLFGDKEFCAVPRPSSPAPDLDRLIYACETAPR